MTGPGAVFIRYVASDYWARRRQREPLYMVALFTVQSTELRSVCPVLTEMDKEPHSFCAMEEGTVRRKCQSGWRPQRERDKGLGPPRQPPNSLERTRCLAGLSSQAVESSFRISRNLGPSCSSLSSVLGVEAPCPWRCFLNLSTSSPRSLRLMAGTVLVIGPAGKAACFLLVSDLDRSKLGILRVDGDKIGRLSKTLTGIQMPKCAALPGLASNVLKSKA